MNEVEMAQDSLEKAHERAETGGNRTAAIMVACFAAIAVIVEMSANDAQTALMYNHVAASDTWAEYQAKSVRRVVYLEAAEILQATAGATPSAAGQARIDAARAQANRMQSEPGSTGMEQLRARALAYEAARAHEIALHDGLERSVRGLQIAIVLLGLFMVTRFRWLFGLGGTLGVLSLLYGLAAGLSLI
ncbi:MAG TPA: DUF4337 family protein [Acetobacteraceae bacterium]|nr:DUF4337 family protein [Acetobacteraceae bacterium]